MVTIIRLLLLIVPALIVLSSVTACAQQTESLVNHSIADTIFSGKSLGIRIGSPTDFSFSSPNATENLALEVSNPVNDTMDVYIAIHRHGDWSIVARLGDVGAHSQKTLNHTLNFTYNGRAVDRDELGVLGRAGDVYAGNVFSVKEDWSGYESQLKSTLSYFGLIAAALMLTILALIAAGVLSLERGTDRGKAGESTRVLIAFLRSLRAAAGKLSYVITTPYFWAVELICGLVLVSIILLFVLNDTSPGIGILIFIIGGTAAVFAPVVYLVAAWLIYVYKREPFRFVASMFMWGVMATLFAFLLNTTATLVVGSFVGKSAALALAAVIVAPIVEETSKGTGLLVMSGQRHFRGPLEGLIFGFSIGMGFAFIENWLYFAVNASPVALGGLTGWTFEIVYRALIDSLGHGCLTGTTGLIMGYVMSRHHSKAFALRGFLLGLPFAMALHATLNFIDVIGAIIPTAFGVPVPLFDPALTFAVAAAYAIIGIFLRRKESRKGRAEAGT